MLPPLIRPPGYLQPSRKLLVGSYQHLLLACLASLLVCFTSVPAVGVLVVTATQVWRLRLIRGKGLRLAEPDVRASMHAAGYFQTARTVLGMLGVALLVGPVSGSLLLYQLVLAGALLCGVALTWQSYKVLDRDAQDW